MTIGIYALVFNGTDKVYIGQSIHIEIRFKEHLYSYSNGHISEKLLEAFEIFGAPSLEILEECTISELDELEEIYIKEFDSVLNGYNIMYRPFTSFQGDRHPNSVITNEEVETLFLYIINNPDTKLVEVSKLLNISKAIIQNITSLKSHTWLKEKYPIEYAKLEALKGTRSKNAKVRNDYPPVISPKNEVYEVKNAKDFANRHSLNYSHLVGVLNGVELVHKGWKLYKENVS